MSKVYEFTVFEQDSFNKIGGGFGEGANPLEAFENAVSGDKINLVRGAGVDIIATSPYGLSIKFQAHKCH